MLDIDLVDVSQYEQDLKKFAFKAWPFATRETINSAAFETKRAYQDRARRVLTLRNSWTARGAIQVERARTLRVKDQEARVGSIADYAAQIEFGGVSRGKRGDKPIATNFAANLGRGVRPRTKLPTRPKKMRNIRLSDRRYAGLGRKARNIAAVQDAASSGNKFVWMDLGRRDGIFKITGGRRKPKVEMVWDLSRKSVSVPANPVLGPATDHVQQRIPKIYQDQLIRQLKRRGLFNY